MIIADRGGAAELRINPESPLNVFGNPRDLSRDDRTEVGKATGDRPGLPFESKRTTALIVGGALLLLFLANR